MTQQYTPVTWQDETTSQQGTLINAERLNQMQTAHHYADGFEEVDAVPTADPSVAYHKVVYCTADSTFYRWDGTEWTKDIDDETKALLQQEIARATEAEGELAQDLADETTARETADTAMQADITAMQSGKLDKQTAGLNQTKIYAVHGSTQKMLLAGSGTGEVPLYNIEQTLFSKMPTLYDPTADTVVNYGWATAQIGAEATARAEADTLLGNRITDETTAREGADTALGNRITAEETRATQAEQANAQAIANTYTKAETDTLLAAKADQATTYTKTEADTLLALKADQATTYTKTETDTLLASKADKSDTYTKAQADTAVQTALDSYAPMVRTTGNQLIAGVKTFTSSIEGTARQFVSQITTTAESADLYRLVMKVPRSELTGIRNHYLFWVFTRARARNPDLLCLYTSGGAINGFNMVLRTNTENYTYVLSYDDTYIYMYIITSGSARDAVQVVLQFSSEGNPLLTNDDTALGDSTTLAGTEYGRLEP